MPLSFLLRTGFPVAIVESTIADPGFICKSAIGREGMEKEYFDTEAFFAALDVVRQNRGKTWKEVAGESGVSASTLTRMAQGKRPDVDGLAALLAWSGLKAENFIKKQGGRPSKRPETLAMISTHLRA